MKLMKSCVIALACLGFAVAAYANEVSLTANEPINITYRVAHKNQNCEPVFGELKSIVVDKQISLPISLDNYDRAGIIIASINGHELPPYANQFDQPERCSMTTDKSKPTGMLELTLFKHSVSCRTSGGVFG